MADESNSTTDSPAAPPPTPSPASAPAVSGTGIGWFGVVVALVVGVAVRLLWARHLDGTVAEWEADTWLRAWFGQDWESVNRIRPVGAGWLYHRISEVAGFPMPGVVFRLAAAGVSVLGLIAALDLAFVVWRGSDIARRSAAFGVRWVVWIWALSPALVGAGVRPDGVSLTGAALCVFVSSMLRWQRHASVATWLLLALSGAALFACGGIAIAVVMAAGLLVYLLPIPPFGSMAATLSAFGVALILGHVAQNGPDVERSWRPDTAGVYSVLSLLDAPPLGGGDNEPDADRRDTAALELAWDQARSTRPFDIGRALLTRLMVDLTGPHRFAELPAPEPVRLGLAVFDGLLRGGLLLFAVAMLTSLRRRGESAFPRAGVVVGFGVLLLVSVAGATGPFSLAGLDLLLLGVAGGGLLGADPDRASSRRLGFLVGGLMLAAFPVAGWIQEDPPSDWLTDFGRRFEQGRVAVERSRAVALAPDDGLARMALAESLLDPYSPFLRLGEPALEHARTGSQLLPLDEASIEFYVRALVEVGRIDEAQEIADQAHFGPEGPTSRQRVLIGWLQLLQRQRRERGDG